MHVHDARCVRPRRVENLSSRSRGNTRNIAITCGCESRISAILSVLLAILLASDAIRGRASGVFRALSAHNALARRSSTRVCRRLILVSLGRSGGECAHVMHVCDVCSCVSHACMHEVII